MIPKWCQRSIVCQSMSKMAGRIKDRTWATAPYSPEYSERTERPNRKLLDVTRPLLHAFITAHLLLLRIKAVNEAHYISNRLISFSWDVRKELSEFIFESLSAFTGTNTYGSKVFTNISIQKKTGKLGECAATKRYSDCSWMKIYILGV